MNTKFDSWLTTQPHSGLIHISKPDLTDENHEDYPVDEWSCRDCQTTVGFYLSGDTGGGWQDCWMITELDEMLCEDCMESVTSELHVEDQPDCLLCGSCAGDEHKEFCEVLR